MLGHFRFVAWALLSAGLLCAPASAITFNQGDSFSRDLTLPSVPSEPILFITTAIEFTDDGLNFDEVLALTFGNAAGDEIFATTIEYADGMGGVDALIGFTAIDKTVEVDPDLVTGREYNFTLAAVQGSVNITSFKLQFFGGIPNQDSPGPGDVLDSPTSGKPFIIKPNPGIVWGNGNSFVVPLPAPALLLLSGLCALLFMARRRASISQA
ncbi:MAG: hypothetical protein AAFQ75_03980 [Pseudomonadota bacterium]